MTTFTFRCPACGSTAWRPVRVQAGHDPIAVCAQCDQITPWTVTDWIGPVEDTTLPNPSIIQFRGRSRGSRRRPGPYNAVDEEIQELMAKPTPLTDAESMRLSLLMHPPNLHRWMPRRLRRWLRRRGAQQEESS